MFETRRDGQQRLRWTLLAGLLAMCGCSGSSGGSATGPDTGTAATTITITSSGVSPKAITISPGTQVTVINRDTVEHQMYSDPHPDHTDCPEFNSVGFLAPGAARQTGNLTRVRTCGFHDHERPLETQLQGNITIR